MTYIRSRFSGPADKAVAEYSASLPFDRRLYRQDITGSIAHARMLARQNIITDEDSRQIISGLESIRKEIEQGKFRYDIELEDIHMAIESSLIEKIGEAGRKLHTARSRNDQIALDTRMFVRDAVKDTLAAIRGLQMALVDLADENKKVIVPGYTHLQAAQPVLLAHHLLAYFEMLERDASRFKDSLKRTNVMPLGSGALAGVPYDIDREFLAEELGFSSVSRNSIDAVSDRDFVLEYEAAAGICMMHISRLSEEIVLWSSAEFGFIELDDAYATSSSIMPQKKNPDAAELARGKTGRVYGHLMALLTTLKGLPLAYDKDMQEDKEGLFDTVDTLISTLRIMAGMVRTLKVNAENGVRAVGRGYILATDLADYLVKKGESFREAHAAVAKLVRYASEKGKSFSELNIKEYRKFALLFDEDVHNISIQTSLAARNVIGGTAPMRVRQTLARARKMIEKGLR